MLIRRQKSFSTFQENEEQKEFASVRGTKKLMKSTLKGIEQFQAKNPGATKEQIQGFVNKNSRLKKGVETLGEHTYKHVGGEQGAKKFIEAVGGKQGKFAQSVGKRMEQIEKNIPKPELPKVRRPNFDKLEGKVAKVAPKIPEPINYPSIKKPSSSFSSDSLRNQMKLRK